MLHHWDSANYFFERPTTADGSNDTAAPDRPPEGYTVKVRDADLLIDLDDMTTEAGGHWAYSADSDAKTMAIQFSVDDGETWSLPLWSQESYANSMEAGANAANALEATQQTNTRVDNLATKIENSVAGVSKIVTASHPDGVDGTVQLTAAELKVRSSTVKVPVADIDGLGAAAKSNEIGDLEGYVTPIPASQRGTANGVPTLDSNSKIKPEWMPNGFGTTGSVAGVTPDGDGDIPKDALVTALAVAKKTDLNAYTKTTDLATVATSGDYNDLTNRPATSAGMLVCDPTTGAWPTRPTTSSPMIWNSVLRSKSQGSDIVPPTGTGGAVAGDVRMSWSPS